MEMGYPNANILTMFKRGTTRVPLDKVVPIANALDDDPAELLRLWLEAYAPGVLPAIEHYMGEMMTANERARIRNLRKALGRVPPYRSDWSDWIVAIVEGV